MASRLFDWHEITDVVESVSRAVVDDGLPDVVVGVLRGGMVVAVMLAHRLGLREVRAIDVTHTLNDGTDALKSATPTVRNRASLGRLDDRDVLVVDDVAGNGATIAAATALARDAGAARVRLAVCILNETSWLTSGHQDPLELLTYVGRRHRGWAIFPWEESR